MRRDWTYLIDWRCIAVIVAASCGLGYEAIAADAQRGDAALPPALSRKLIESINRVYSKDRLERLRTVKELRDMGPKAAHAAPFLVTVLSDRTVVIVPDQTVVGSHEEGIARSARDALIAIGSAAVPVLQAAIKSSPDANTRALSAEAMHVIIFGPRHRRKVVVTRYEVDDTCVELWLAAMKDRDGRVRMYATEGLAHAGPKSVAPVLLAALRDECEGVRLAALKGVSRRKIEEAANTIVPLLGQKTLEPEVRRALESIGAAAVEPLISAIADKDCPYQERACWALHGSRDPKALPALHAALRHDDALVREWAANTLAGIADARSLDPLVVALRDVSPDVRHSAGHAIASIQDTDKSGAVQPLIKVLQNDEHWLPRKSAAFALGGLRALKPDVRDAVIDALSQAKRKDKNKVVRETAAKALESIKKGQGK